MNSIYKKESSSPPATSGRRGVDRKTRTQVLQQTGLLVCLAGTAVFILFPDGMHAVHYIAYAMMFGGFLVFLGAWMFHGDSVERRITAQAMATVISFPLLLGGMWFVGLAYEGVEDAKRFMVYGVSGILVGIAGLTYGLKYKQNRIAAAIGNELGFYNAANEPTAPAGGYEFRGVMNGIKVFFNISETSSGEGGGDNIRAGCILPLR